MCPGGSTLLHSDLTLNSTYIRLHIKASKTDPFRQGQTVTIGATNTSTFPLRALKNYLELLQSTPSQPSSPLFVFKDKAYLTRSKLTTTLRNLLLVAGLKPDHSASHSFRIGTATSAAAARLPDWQIQAMGRWSSNCYTRYIRRPHSTVATVGSECRGHAAHMMPRRCNGESGRIGEGIGMWVEGTCIWE